MFSLLLLRNFLAYRKKEEGPPTIFVLTCAHKRRAMVQRLLRSSWAHGKLLRIEKMEFRNCTMWDLNVFMTTLLHPTPKECFMLQWWPPSIILCCWFCDIVVTCYHHNETYWVWTFIISWSSPICTRPQKCALSNKQCSNLICTRGKGSLCNWALKFVQLNFVCRAKCKHDFLFVVRKLSHNFSPCWVSGSENWGEIKFRDNNKLIRKVPSLSLLSSLLSPPIPSFSGIGKVRKFY